MMTFRDGLLGLAAAVLAACLPSAGLVQVTVVWGSPPPNDRQLFAFARVERRDRSRAPAVSVRSDPILIEPHSAVSLRDVPNGDSLVVVVDVRPSPYANERILYSGTSHSFSLQPGRRVQLAVVLQPEQAADWHPNGPSPPDTARIVYQRQPWGTSAQHDPSYRLVGEASAALPGSTVIAFDREEVGKATVLGRAAVASDGSFTLPLAGPAIAQVAQVYVAVRDAAGNLSSNGAAPSLQAGLVPSVRWTASLGGKVQGSVFPNPHRITITPATNPALKGPATEPPTSDLLAVAAIDGHALESPGSVTWVQVSGSRSQSGSAPPARSSTALAYDAAHGRLVLFGGTGSSGALADTWEWDGSTWLDRTPPASPAPRYEHALAYDAARGRVVLFGGFAEGEGAARDTWEWDGSTWLERTPASSPPARFGHAMAYDAARARVVLLGGASGLTGSAADPRADTWEWDGSTWREEKPRSLPPPRILHAMAYDALRRRVVLFGGFSAAFAPGAWGGARADTWEWDGSRWLERHPTSGPAPHGAHAIAYDAARGRVVLFGGASDSGSSLHRADDTWEWNGSTWLERQPASSPPARLGHAMAYDAARRRVVVFGGVDGTGRRADLWAWDGSAWTGDGPRSAPLKRAGHAMVYDAAHDRAVLFGGVTATSSTATAARVLADTWEWNGSTWLEDQPPSSPPARRGHAMAYDVARGRAVMFGGSNYPRAFADTWEWDGSSWVERTPPVSPPSRSDNAMAYDAARERVVLFGGYCGNPCRSSEPGGELGDTWEWDGSTWLEHEPRSSPSPRYNYAFAFDVARARAVLFGGYSGRDEADTWTWDGASWLQQSPPSLPPAGYLQAMAYDAGRERAVLFGGISDLNISGRTWEWDGSTWLERKTSASPPPRVALAMAYDAARGRILLYGGGGSGGRLFDDSWALASTRPSILLDVDWAAALADAADIDRLTLTAAMAGRGASSGVPGAGGSRPGAASFGWNARQGRWSECESNTADLGAPALASYVAENIDAQRFVDGERQMHFRFETRSGSSIGPEPARAALDYVEVMVEYRVGAGAHPACGNGRVEIQAGELCDDGNIIDGDGCSSACIVERGWACSRSPSACVVCGDGTLGGSKECDDGNLENGDGCNDVCLVEPGWACSGAPSRCDMVPSPRKTEEQRRRLACYGRMLQTLRAPLQVQPGSMMQASLHPSPLMRFPSSHSSAPSTIPLPQTVQTLGSREQLHPRSTLQSAEQPSPSAVFPSSQTSRLESSILPLPQAGFAPEPIR